eukprot:2920260-Pleurochrysis_carterae.AAC.1
MHVSTKSSELAVRAGCRDSRFRQPSPSPSRVINPRLFVSSVKCRRFVHRVSSKFAKRSSTPPANPLASLPPLSSPTPSSDPPLVAVFVASSSLHWRA